MRKGFFWLALIGLLVVGLAVGPDLWAAPGQAPHRQTVPTRTPVPPPTEPPPPSGETPAAPTATPVPPTATPPATRPPVTPQPTHARADGHSRAVVSNRPPLADGNSDGHGGPAHPGVSHSGAGRGNADPWGSGRAAVRLPPTAGGRPGAGRGWPAPHPGVREASCAVAAGFAGWGGC
jgi:hypothetical protein